jgi:hypothetical protein
MKIVWKEKSNFKQIRIVHRILMNKKNALMNVLHYRKNTISSHEFLKYVLSVSPVLLRSLREVAVVLLGPPPWWILSFWAQNGVRFATSSCACFVGHTPM